MSSFEACAVTRSGPATRDETPPIRPGYAEIVRRVALPPNLPESKTGREGKVPWKVDERLRWDRTEDRRTAASIVGEPE